MPGLDLARWPVAVLGMGLRLPPDIDRVDALWRLMMDGRRTVGPVPSERWEPFRAASPQVDGVLRRVVRSGSFLDDIQGFDAQFFGISPREARVMDPQQRLALEVTWRALEHSGIPARSIAGTDTGVFIGVADSDYGRQLLADLPEVDAMRVSGAFHYGVPNRISHLYDLHGPSMAVDTACASSLSALHLAVQHLQTGQIPLALAGGTHLMIGPAPMLGLDEAGTLAPDGLSKPFSACGDGYGRGEGVGIVVLKRLADAQADGDRVLAVILGSTVNQDGWTVGMMAPSAPAQAHMLRTAYAHVGIDVRDLDYVEAHGTGTPVGDSVEATALAEVIGSARPEDDPCLIGSVKGNIGHLEAASGVAGLIKTVLCLRAGVIPATAGVSDPLNPALDWPTSGLHVVRETTPWPTRARPRRAGLSNFGAGGTGGHIVLEQAPESGANRRQPVRRRRAGLGGTAVDHSDADQAARSSAALSREPRMFVCSGMSERGMRASAADLAAHLGGSITPDLSSVAHTLMARRSALVWRGVAVAADPDQLLEGLRALGNGEPRQGVAVGRVITARPTDAVWVFSGQGSHWRGMGAALLAEPAFEHVLSECEPVFAQELGIDCRAALTDDPLDDIAHVQALTYLMQVALAALWRSYGVRPAAVIGHSLGEIAAAVTAGVYSLTDGARLACRRARLMRAAQGHGTMALVGMGAEEAREQLADQPVTVAVHSSPGSCVISGDTDAVQRWCRRWQEQQVFVRPITTTVASHSAHMDPLLAGIAEAAAGLTVHAPTIPLYTTALDDPRSQIARDARYWQANLRNPVRFHQAVTAAAADGHRLLLEVSAHPVVTHSITETVAGHHDIDDFAIAHSLRRETGAAELLANLAALHCAGLRIDSGTARWSGELLDLPGTSWQHTTFWTKPLVPHGGHDPDSSSLLGTPTQIAEAAGQRLWETRLDAAHRPFTHEHKVHGVDIVPAATLINTFLDAARQSGHCGVLHDITLRTPVPTAPARRVQVVLRDGRATLFSQAEGADAATGWLAHTTAQLTAADQSTADAPDPPDLAGLADECDTVMDHHRLLELLEPLGVEGFAFGWQLSELRRGPHTLRARVQVPRPANSPAGNWAPLLDAAMSVSSVLLLDDPEPQMPSAVGRVSVHGDPIDNVAVDIKRDTADGSIDITVTDAPGTRMLAAVHHLTFSPLGHGTDDTPAAPHKITHQVHWRRWTPSSQATPPRQAIVVTASTPPPTWLDRALAAAGIPVTVTTPQGLPRCSGLIDPATAVLVVPSPRPTPSDGDRENRHPIAGTAEHAAWLLFETIQHLSRATAGPYPRLWTLTHRTTTADTPDALAHAVLRGAGRAAAGEHPELWAGHIDLDTAAPHGPTLAAVLADTSGEDTYRIDGADVHIPRLAPPAPAPHTAPAPACRPDGTYLITGGLGALGIETAHWLLTRGARRLILLNRTPLPARSTWDSEHPPTVRARIDAVRALEAHGAGIHLATADVADHDATAAALTALTDHLPPIRGIVHIAGISRSQLITQLDPDILHAVLAPKIDGTLVLHDLFPPGSLDFFVLYSSIGQLIHSTGQGAYATANAFIDAFAHHRGGDTISLAWPGWRNLGLYATATDIFTQEMSISGTGDVSADTAFRCWEHAQHLGLHHAIVLPITARPRTPLPLLNELNPPDSTQPAPTDNDNALDWATLTPDQQHTLIADTVAQEISHELQMPADDIDRLRPLIEMGLDSRMTLSIRVRLEHRLNTRLPATLLWQHPTLDDLTNYLRTTVAPT
ncbi:acyltransferase domain-containing protein [Actinomadura sp. 9N215]|uniref:type I polyketide synthase n=1 Tax=Actinomadura sp. 9N215 TaxID=3375150 RepID=UPI00378AA009